VVYSFGEVRENRHAVLHIRSHVSDEAAMEKLRRDHLKLVQLELEYFAARDAAKKKVEAAA
jgi:hypothetical protein